MPPEKSCKWRYYYRIVQSQFGDIYVVWKASHRDAKIIQVVLPKSKPNTKRGIRVINPIITRNCPLFINRICKKIERFVSGEPVGFSLRYFDTAQLYHFQKRVLLLEKEIPCGRVTTYGRLAKKLGTPRAARAVGTALSRNPFPIVIPCHRTIRSDGSLGGFSGGLRLKRQLLELEGVRFDKSGKVIMEDMR